MKKADSSVVYLRVILLNTGLLNFLQTLFTEGSHLFHLISRGLGLKHINKEKTRN